VTIHTPNAGTGLSGEWLLGPSGGVRVDLCACPDNIVVDDRDKAWATVRDLLSAAVVDPEPLAPVRRWRSTRALHAGPVRHHPDAIVVDKDCAVYAAPLWVMTVAQDDSVDFGVLVSEDTGLSDGLLVMRRVDEVVAFSTLRRLT